ncbi:aspartyl-phosphate phosphatase Spo0E family protein, partial [Clostridioides difficile]
RVDELVAQVSEMKARHNRVVR